MASLLRSGQGALTLTLMASLLRSGQGALALILTLALTLTLRDLVIISQRP